MQTWVRWGWVLLAVVGASCAVLPAPGAAEPGGGGFLRAASGSTLTGDFRHHRVHSAFLPDDRTVIVYLPPSYAVAPQRRYPVLYLHDGNNVFDRATAFLGREWEVDETAQALIAARRIRELVIVGVHNTPARIFEYTWIPRPRGEPAGGGGERYGRLLAEEVKPLVDRTYRTLPGREDSAVMGSSLGGLVSLYLGRHRGDVFGRVGAVSPSLWWAERAALGAAATMRRDLHIWLDMGTREGESAAEQRENVANSRALRDALLARGYRLGADLGYFEDEGGTHDEPAWARRVHRPLEFFFPVNDQASRSPASAAP